MKKLFIPVVVLLFSFGLSAQVKHEVKFSFLDLTQSIILPSYEIITANNKLGLEIEAGINFQPAWLNYLDEDLNVTEITQYKRRKFESLVALKYYFFKKDGPQKYGFYAGPMFRVTRINFLEDSYFSGVDVVQETSPDFEGFRLGEREFGPGVVLGGSVVLKRNLVVNFGVKQMFRFSERSPGEFESNSIYWNYSLKFGYRFGGQEKADKPVG